MRDILKKVTTGSMIAGAALLVAACGGETAENTATTDLGNDTMLDANESDMGMDMNAMDMNATDMNAMDMNTTDMNASENMTDTNAQ